MSQPTMVESRGRSCLSNLTVTGSFPWGRVKPCQDPGEGPCARQDGGQCWAAASRWRLCADTSGTRHRSDVLHRSSRACTCRHGGRAVRGLVTTVGGSRFRLDLRHVVRDGAAILTSPGGQAAACIPAPRWQGLEHRRACGTLQEAVSCHPVPGQQACARQGQRDCRLPVLSAPHEPSSVSKFDVRVSPPPLPLSCSL